LLTATVLAEALVARTSAATAANRAFIAIFLELLSGKPQ